MHLQLDGRLLEEAVFREILAREQAGGARAGRAYRAQVDTVYEECAADAARDLGQELRQLHDLWFTELGFRAAIGERIGEFPFLIEGIDLTSIEEAPRRRAEGAELFVRRAEGEADGCRRTLVISLCPESFQDLERLRPFLRRELQHVSDMLDPTFDFVPDIGAVQGTTAQLDLVRDRYAVLWDLSIERRLGEREASATSSARIPRRLAARARAAFANLANDELATRVQSAWSLDPPTHAGLLEIAKEGLGVLEEGSVQGGSPCPLCGFPTHSWVRGPAGVSCLQCAEMLGTSHEPLASGAGP